MSNITDLERYRLERNLKHGLTEQNASSSKVAGDTSEEAQVLSLFHYGGSEQMDRIHHIGQGQNIVSMDRFKKLKNEQAQLDDYLNYLKELDAQELIRETKGLLQDLKLNSFDLNSVLKGEGLMSEYAKRLETDSPDLGHSVSEMKKLLRRKYFSISLE